MRKWIPTIVIAIVLVVYIAIDAMAEHKAEQQVAQSFPMRYVIGYIDSMFMEQNKYIEMIASATIYNNAVLRMAGLGDTAELANINRALSGSAEDEMLQYGADDVVDIPYGAMGIRPYDDSLVCHDDAPDTLYRGWRGQADDH